MISFVLYPVDTELQFISVHRVDFCEIRAVAMQINSSELRLPASIVLGLILLLSFSNSVAYGQWLRSHFPAFWDTPTQYQFSGVDGFGFGGAPAQGRRVLLKPPATGGADFGWEDPFQTAERPLRRPSTWSTDPNQGPNRSRPSQSNSIPQQTKPVPEEKSSTNYGDGNASFALTPPAFRRCPAGHTYNRLFRKCEIGRAHV